jgi:hypothetical protein
MSSPFAKAEILKFTVIRHMLIAGRKSDRKPTPPRPLLCVAVSPSAVVPDTVGGH